MLDSRFDAANAGTLARSVQSRRESIISIDDCGEPISIIFHRSPQTKPHTSQEVSGLSMGFRTTSQIGTVFSKHG
jgi:hypothetical protein